MIAHSAVLKEIAASAGRPASEVLQSARILGEHGLYDRPGRGARSPRITLSSIANVALAIAAGGPMTAHETVRRLRPLVSQGTWETRAEPKNRLAPKRGFDFRKRVVDNRPIWPGKTLGEFIEELVDLTAAAGAANPWREPESDLVSFFRNAELEITIRAADLPMAEASMFLPKEEGEEFLRVWSCSYVPPECGDTAPQLAGVSRDGVIRFQFLETLAALWRQSLGVDTLPISA